MGPHRRSDGLVGRRVVVWFSPRQLAPVRRLFDLGRSRNGEGDVALERGADPGFGCRDHDDRYPSPGALHVRRHLAIPVQSPGDRELSHRPHGRSVLTT